jgi:hypothetical protein
MRGLVITAAVVLCVLQVLLVSVAYDVHREVHSATRAMEDGKMVLRHPTWTSGGETVDISTKRGVSEAGWPCDPSENIDQWKERHRGRVEEARAAFPPDPE